ncbi:NAD(+) kinase [Saitoella coloradoensis]
MSIKPPSIKAPDKDLAEHSSPLQLQTGTPGTGRLYRPRSINTLPAQTLAKCQLSAGLPKTAHPEDILLSALKSPCFTHPLFSPILPCLETIVSPLLTAFKSGDRSFSSSAHLVETATSVRHIASSLSHTRIKTPMKNVMIVTKARDHALVGMTREVCEWLMMQRSGSGSELGRGVRVWVDKQLERSTRFGVEDMKKRVVERGGRGEVRFWEGGMCWEKPELFDFVLTLGGDGTVLYSSWLFQRIVPPVLSFSLGSLGFLTPFGFEKHESILEDIFKNGIQVNLRMRFTCTIYRSAPDGQSTPEESTHQHEVLNEITIDRGPSPYLSNLHIYSGNTDKLLTIVQADGLILSTPTGSTAYSLSAGGSLVHPDISAMLLTPICPHTLSFRPMLLPDTMSLRIHLPLHARSSAWCAFDGRGRTELNPGDSVLVGASRWPFPTVSVGGGEEEFVESVGRTLRWNVREGQKGFGSGSGKEGGKGV